MEIMIHMNDVCVVDDEFVSTYQNKGYETLITDVGFRNHPEYVNWNIFNHIDTIYPLTIKPDRYSGVYSGGVYTAWPCDEAEIPSEVFMDDVSCAHEWGVIKSERQNVGIGCTPSVALVDLYLKMHSIFIEDYMFTVKNTGDGISIKPLNERPIKINFETARKIAELLNSKTGATADAVNDDNERVTDIAEMETEPYHDDIDPEWYSLRLELIDLDNAALMIYTYATDYDSDIDTAIHQTEGGMLVVDVINKKTHKSATVFWNDDETFSVSFKERLLGVLRKLST